MIMMQIPPARAGTAGRPQNLADRVGAIKINHPLPLQACELPEPAPAAV